MHALVIAAPREARIEDIPVPEPGPTEVRVRMEGCGICGSNLPVWEGRPWFDYPIEPGAPGHEGWGQIDAVGTEVTGLEAGTRVAVLSYHAFAEYDIASAAAVVPIPPALSSVPFPGEALGCAMNVLRRACVQKGDLVAIVGIGFLGAVLTRLCVERGATVIAISRRKTALELARASGAWLTFDYDDGQKIVEEVGALSDGAFCDVVLEVTGKQGPLDLATELTRPRGRLVIAGYHQDGRRTVDMRLWNWR
ncbi:MAG TPA: zinc-binding dehydrogenase, partial [Planctomycetota bacterium]|nr:zinc-binding dehydrogenase [Planctomycetota bacterium]